MKKPTAEQGMNWDLSAFFPEFDGSEMRDFKKSLQEDVKSLLESASNLDPLDAENGRKWEEIYLSSENALSRLIHLGSYVGCLTAADANNEAYLKEEGRLALLGAEFSKLEVELLRALKNVSDETFGEFSQREALADARFFLDRTRIKSKFTMSSEMEGLSADLGVDSIEAWGRLYDTVSGKLEFDMVFPDGKQERLPISQRRSLMENSDRETRRAAFLGGNSAWETVQDVAASALNAISGTRLTLNKYRRVPHFLDVALFQSAITQKTLDAMFEAIFSQIDLARNILKFKAGAMGIDRISWYDLGAPLPFPDLDPVSWGEGTALVQSAFERSYPNLGEFTQSMYDRLWIDWEPRSGKRPGGFCTSSMEIGESRIFMTFNDTMGDVLTLAHEVGHAFHSHVLKGERTLSQLYPMTLAESASTFGEMILADGVIADPDTNDLQKAMILDMEVSHGAVYLMDIPVRFKFEEAMYRERASGELSVSRLKELMVETQQEVFGEVLDPGGGDPYFWASKLHFYITGATFYNFPYTFGFLLSRGLFAKFKSEGPDFLPRYEEFLRLTGSDTAENVARRSIGCDLETPDFWVEAIRSMEEPMRALQELAPAVLPQSGKSDR
jgi:oligoendopeptidase F